MKKMSLILLCCSAFLVACDKASEKISDATGDGKNLLDKAGSLVSDVSSDVSNDMSDVASEMTEKASESINDTVDATKDTVEKVVEGAQEKVTAVVDSAKASANDAVDSVKDAGKKVADNVSDKVDTVVAAVATETVAGADLGANLKEGEKVFKSSCIACHGSGIAGSPKVGEKADWEARIAQGKAVMVDHAINGFRGEEGYYMPAKGGSKHLSDEQITMVVEYMISKVK